MEDLIEWWCMKCDRMTLWRKVYTPEHEIRVCCNCNPKEA